MTKESLRGHYLIACKHMRDPNFHKTVVLVIEHGSDGAMGLVVNRPSSVSIASALSHHFDLPDVDDLVFIGGPVEPSALFLLHNAPVEGENALAVLPGVSVASSADIFEAVIDSLNDGDADLRFRFFSGCAGWAPGQLEGELDRGDWYVTPATPDLVFHEDPYSVWQATLNRLPYFQHLFPEARANPNWN